MSDPVFLVRLSEAIQRQHEANMDLQMLASELIDHTQRMRGFVDKLNAHVVAAARQEIAPPATGTELGATKVPITYPSSAMDIDHMPQMLRGGPVRGER